jgi:hypothetical protein
MKRSIILFSILISIAVRAQENQAPYFRLDFGLPISSGLSANFINGSSENKYADHFIESNKPIGIYFTLLDLQLHFDNRFFIFGSIHRRSQSFNRNEALYEMRKNNPDYRIQQESVYKYDNYVTPGFSGIIHNFNAGFGIDIHLQKNHYLQPQVAYSFGPERLAKERYAFKATNSNYYFIREFNDTKGHVKGFTVGLQYKSYFDRADNKPGPVLSNAGCSFSFCHMKSQGTGSYTDIDLYALSTGGSFRYKVKYNFISIGFFVGINSKRSN